MYHGKTEDPAAMKKSYRWLEKAGLKDSTEALIMAAQQQALSIRAEAGVSHTREVQAVQSGFRVSQAHSSGMQDAGR